MTEKFKLKLSNHVRNISSEILRLRQDGDFLDVTLVGEDGCHIEAHKIVLSANSELFKKMFKMNVHPHPLIYMKGLKPFDLEALISFVYKGEVTVNQDNLNDFLTLAQDWKINGLEERLDEKVEEVLGEVGSFLVENLEYKHNDYTNDPLKPNEKEKDDKQENKEIKVMLDALIPKKKSSPKTKLKIEFRKEECEYCGKRFTTNYQVKRHKRKMHNKRDQPLKCTKTFCGALFDTVAQKVKHSKSCVFKCTWNDCEIEIDRSDRVEVHMRAHSARPHALLIPIHKSPKIVIPLPNSDMEAKLKGIWNEIKQ